MPDPSDEKANPPIKIAEENLGQFGTNQKDVHLSISRDYHPEPNSKLKLWISGIMAGVLWIGTGAVIGCHLYSITDLGYKLSQVEAGTANSKEKVANFQISISAVDGTAKGLYSFLTPFAAAVTGFYFNEASTNRQKEK